MRMVRLASGEEVPQLGQGTWMMAERAERRAGEIRALQLGLDLGLTLIDTAEMYGEGRAEELVAEAISGRRDGVFLVSKVYPHNAGRGKLTIACEKSLARLKTDRIDLYLLHWRENMPLEETVAGFEMLKKEGKIRHWGVSNFDSGDMDDLMGARGRACAANQILYNLTRRGAEWYLMPSLAEQHIPVMAYSPIEQGRLKAKDALTRVARAHNATPYQIALAWTMRSPNVIAIPKAGAEAHVRENAAALSIALSPEDLAALDAAYPPPKRKTPLEMI